VFRNRGFGLRSLLGPLGRRARRFWARAEMADNLTQFLAKSKTTGSAEDPRIAEILRRVERARLDRQRHQARLDACYKYALPWRHKRDQNQPTDQLDEIFASTAMTTLEDFAADMLNTFTPQKAAWVEIAPVTTFQAAVENKQVAAGLEKQLKAYQKVLFDEMARSNLYQALQEAYLDLGPGTMALTIHDINKAEPIHCQAIPAGTELLIDRGIYGGVDGRWREWACRAEDILTLWPHATPADLSQQWRRGDLTEYNIIDGVYRDWSDRSAECWCYTVLCNNKIILDEKYSGAGSCPMPVARWSRDSTTAWGVGPTYRSTPDIKTENHVKYLGLKNLDKIVDPAFTFEDDGVLNFDQGITPGTGMPRAVGSKAPEMMESKGRFDVQFMELDDLRSSIRRAHYQDRPEQQGKTPPTATQWADEAAERARRMGSPATNLVLELQYPIIKRFAYLLEKRGVLPKIELNGEKVSVEPVSPLLRAQEQEEVIRLDRFAEMIAARFGPAIANIIIDQIKYASKLADLLGVEKDLLRDEAGIKKAIEQFAGLLQQGNTPTDLSAPPSGAGVVP
jgi:hypothetical protein